MLLASLSLPFPQCICRSTCQSTTEWLPQEVLRCPERGKNMAAGSMTIRGNWCGKSWNHILFGGKSIEIPFHSNSDLRQGFHPICSPVARSCPEYCSFHFHKCTGASPWNWSSLFAIYIHLSTWISVLLLSPRSVYTVNWPVLAPAHWKPGKNWSGQGASQPLPGLCCPGIYGFARRPN